MDILNKFLSLISISIHVISTHCKTLNVIVQFYKKCSKDLPKEIMPSSFKTILYVTNATKLLKQNFDCSVKTKNHLY